jgi:hypothetical protein
MWFIQGPKDSGLNLQRGLRQIDSRDEAMFLCEHITNIAIEKLEERGQMLLECIGVLGQIVSSSHGRDWYVRLSHYTLISSEPQVSEFASLALSSINIDEPAGGGEWIPTYVSYLADGSAMLLEICNLLAAYRLPSKLTPKLLAVISRGLRPSEKTPSTSQISHIPSPNTHVLIIRCLIVLPELLLDAQLGETEMGTLMEGLNSPDDTIRRSVSGISSITELS